MMAGTIWSKWYWSDWESDPALKLCGFAAQGLWMRLLCIASAHDPIGYVAVNNRPLDSADITRMTGGTEPEVSGLLDELAANGVFSRDAKGRIYSRRMIRDAKKASIARKNGKKGGNPKLLKQTVNKPLDIPPVKAPDNGGLKTHKPESRVQSPEEEERVLSTTVSLDPSARAWDSVSLADQLCRVAGVRNIDPGRIAGNAAIVREWIDAGADPPQIAEIIQARRDQATSDVYSLKYFDPAIRQAVARKEFPNAPGNRDLSKIRDPLLRRYLERGGTLEN